MSPSFDTRDGPLSFSWPLQFPLSTTQQFFIILRVSVFRQVGLCFFFRCFIGSTPSALTLAVQSAVKVLRQSRRRTTTE